MKRELTVPANMVKCEDCGKRTSKAVPLAEVGKYTCVSCTSQRTGISVKSIELAFFSE